MNQRYAKEAKGNLNRRRFPKSVVIAHGKSNDQEVTWYLIFGVEIDRTPETFEMNMTRAMRKNTFSNQPFDDFFDKTEIARLGKI